MNWVYRDGEQATMAPVAAAQMLARHNGKLSLEQLGGGDSDNGHARYVYGRYSLDRAIEIERGHYLQVWQYEGAGRDS